MSDRQNEARKKAGTDSSRTVSLARGLSTKLLLLTALFVLIAEVLVFVPSIANFRLNWLAERLEPLPPCRSCWSRTMPARCRGRSRTKFCDRSAPRRLPCVTTKASPACSSLPKCRPSVDEHIDLGNTGLLSAMSGALDTLAFGGNRMLRVFGKVGDSTKEFELIISDSRLRDAMLVYSRNVALLSLMISLSTAMLVYYTIDRIMIRPIRAMTQSMLDFSRRPDDPGRIIDPDERGDEIGVAERELADMQTRLQKTLGEQKHLADLGLAVSKINHDMRNILASAQLMSDRLGAVKDPTVQALAPRLLKALDRAVSYSSGVLAYGRTQEPPPSRRRLRLWQVVEDVQNLLGIEPDSKVEFVNAVDPVFEIDADPEQLFRVLTNLCRNAIQAMTAGSDSRRRQPPDDLGGTAGHRLPYPGHRHRSRPAAKGAGKPVHRLPRLGAQWRHRPGACDRARAGARSRRLPWNWWRASADERCFR